MNSEGDLLDTRLQDHKDFNWKGFTYFSEDRDRGKCGMSEESLSKISSSNDSSVTGTPTFSLAMAKVGDRVQIVSLNCDEANNRLMGMGLMPGEVLDVVSCMATGSTIVALHDHRLGLGAEMAQQIQVTQVGSPLGTEEENLFTNQVTKMKTTTGNSGVKLRDAAIDSTFKVVGYEPTARDYKRKLLAMGLTPGTEFVVKRHAPLGDPTEIELRGFHLSLRKAEADALIVEQVQGAES